MTEELRRRAFEKTVARVREALSQPDVLIVHAVKTVDLIDKASNLLFEKFRDWHALYVPELAGAAPDMEAYLGTALLGERKNYSRQNLVKTLGGEEAERLAQAVQNSAGADLAEEDLKQLAEFGERILSLRELRTKVEEYGEGLVKKQCPNLAAVCGELLAARLVAATGSLKRLSELPSSTVQVLGAEKALFAHLQKGTKPPKHGIIFQHPAIRTRPLKLRGRAARRLAAKISIAAKIDFFRGEFCGDRLARELEEELKKVRA